ncbi:hypothetical protein LDENG_00005640 [Lucifuga dentata]|nr:hypothetical protein LDENG_00005640 [Lucifuga dentata]
MAAYKPRVINLTKTQGQTFGFYLRVEHGEEGHLIRCLEMGGPAELAGMKDGDRILRVNRTFVDGLSHSQVVDIVKDSGASITFHILDEDSYKQAKAEGRNLSDPHATPVAQNRTKQEPKPKLCYLVKSSSGFGFSLRTVRGEQGFFMTEVSPGGVAERAGVKVSDRLLEVNGENIEGSTHEQVVEKIKLAGSTLMFLLVDEETDKYYQNKRIKPRIADITKGSDGYGFFLRQDPKETVHLIKDIDRGSPAERAGLMDEDRLVAVDGAEVDSCSHEQVVDRIRQSGNKCCLLVVNKDTDQMYKMGGVSPMIFFEEMKGSIPPPSYTEAVNLPAPVRPATPVQERDEQLKPKLCRMEKTPAGYGFHLNGIQGVWGQSIKQVVPGGAADRAGLEDEDVVMEVNGVNVEKSTHEEVVELIRNSGNSLVMLVAQKSIYEQLRAKGAAIMPQLLRKTSDIQVHSADMGKEEKQVEVTRPETPPVQTRERTPSQSSSSSLESLDERL